MRSFFYFLFLSYGAIGFAQETFVPVCDRTPAVRAAILDMSRSMSCSEILPSTLERIYHLTLNNVGELKPGDFSGLGEVNHIIFNDCRLKSLSRGTFSGLHSVSWIALDCELEHIEAGAFNLPSLTDIDLSRNKLEVLNSGVFDGADGLERIDLSEQPLEEIPNGTFSNLKNLQEIIVTGTPLSRTEGAAFRLISGGEVRDLPPTFNVDSSGEWTP